MASFVWVNGYLSSLINSNARILLIDSLRKKDVRDDKFEKVPCIYWNHHANCELNRLSEGTHVSLKGRIEFDDEIGVYILVESMEFLSPPPKN